jgi:phage FluMu protein gp41
MNRYGFAVNMRIQRLVSVYGQSYVDVDFGYELLRVCISQIGQINFTLDLI